MSSDSSVALGRRARRRPSGHRPRPRNRASCSHRKTPTTRDSHCRTPLRRRVGVKLMDNRPFRHAHVRHDAEVLLNGCQIWNCQADPQLGHGRIVLKEPPLLGPKPPLLVRLEFHLRLKVHHGRLHAPMAGEQRGLEAGLVTIGVANRLNGLELEGSPILLSGEDRAEERFVESDAAGNFVHEGLIGSCDDRRTSESSSFSRTSR